MKKIKEMKNDLHTMKRILYYMGNLSGSCQMALPEAVEVQASQPTMIVAEEGLTPSKIEKNKRGLNCFLGNIKK